MRRSLILIFVGLLFLPGTAIAKERLDRNCLSFIGPEAVAAICDPEQKLRGSIHLAGQSHFSDSSGTSFIDRDRALGQGETVYAYWRRASRRAVLYLSGAGRSSVFPLRQFGNRVEAKLTASGSFLLQGKRQAIIEERGLSPEYRFAAASPQQALSRIERALTEVDRNRGLRELCRSLDGDSRRFYLYFYGLPDQVGCLGALRVFFLGTDGRSRVGPSESQLIQLRQHSDRIAYARLALTHQIRAKGPRPNRLSTEVTILLHRDQQGNWRLANPQSLMPLNIYRFRSDPPARNNRQARQEWRLLRNQGLFWQQRFLGRHLAAFGLVSQQRFGLKE